MTPAAISETKVAVATIRQRTNQMGGARDADMFRHVEVFDLAAPSDQPPVKVTQVVWPLGRPLQPLRAPWRHLHRLPPRHNRRR